MPDLESLRSRAVAVAYRMLGSRTDAEDIAQTTMIRVQSRLDDAGDTDPLRSPEAFTTTVATRLSIDHLRSARVRREQYVGPWLPEPVAGSGSVGGVGAERLDPIASGDPAAVADLGDSLSFAFLVVLESLGPVERAAFLLHETFGYGYDELATILDRSEDSCRQLVSRAKRRLADGRPRFTVDDAEHRELLERFVAAARGGDVDALVGLLAPDADLVSDGGANRKAARHPVVGRDRVVRFVQKIGPRVFQGADVTIEPVNGELAFVLRARGQVTLVGLVETSGGQVTALRWVSNPDKLGWV